MTKMIVSWDLNGSTPTHVQMDEYFKSITTNAKRELETVWSADYYGTVEQLRDSLMNFASSNDRILVANFDSAAWYNLLN
jgi:predicted 3-demethylubiquinone-9 3-methyltransferase (glyoxalase superfamily)